MAFGRTHGVSSTGVRWYYGGDCVGNIRHGFGVCFWENGDRYEGSWADDKTDGCGVYVQGDGARYDGQFFQHKMHGFGICTYADGDRCEGQWRAGEFSQPCAVPAEIIDFARHSANQARQASQGMASMPPTTSGISSFPLQVWQFFSVVPRSCFWLSRHFPWIPFGMRLWYIAKVSSFGFESISKGIKCSIFRAYY